MSLTENRSYKTGDWVVHNHYGVGQIKAIEIKTLNGEKVPYFKAETTDSTFWFPNTNEDNPRIRPISSDDMVQKFIKTVRRKPGNLDKDKKFWVQEIHTVQAEGGLLTVSKLIRDLSAQATHRKLTQSEGNALDRFKERFLKEWSVVSDKQVDELRPQLQNFIQESKSKVEPT